MKSKNENRIIPLGLGKCNYLILSLSVSLLLLQTGCKKFVEIDPPITKIVTATVFNNDASAIAAQTVIYSQMGQESYNLALTTGLLSDELTNYGNNTERKLIYSNAMIASYRDIGPWQSVYNYIYQANAIIEGLQNTKGVTLSVMQQLTGESKFLRAYWYFYLTNIYGDVPLVTSTDYTINSVIARSPRSQVYQQIVADLLDAQQLLNSNYIDGSNNTGTLERVRPTKWAATALLARVYLYTNKPADAEAQATAVIQNTGSFNLINDLNQIFLANSNEAIWQLQTPLPTGTNTNDGFYFILISSPVSGGNNYGTGISPQLLNSFEPNDHRKRDWIGTFQAGSDTYYFPYKYKVRQSTIVTEYTMVLRLAEQYLIRAEARARQNNLSGAMEDVNLLRLKHGGLISPLPVPDTQSDCLSLTLHERQVELFTEWGNRWFDLIRTGNANAVMGGPNGVCHLKGGVWNPDGRQELYPIPQSERSKDPNLTQNPGY